MTSSDSMPTAAQFKQQASRLAQFLGLHHRISLKRTTALEAIAFMQGARNWQTLAASCDPEAVTAVTAVTSDTPAMTRGHAPLASARQGPAERLFWNWAQKVGLDIRPSRITGSTSERDAWFGRALREHVEAGHPALFMGVSEEVLQQSGGAGLARELDCESLLALQADFEADQSLLRYRRLLTSLTYVRESTLALTEARAALVHLVQQLCAVPDAHAREPFTVALMSHQTGLVSELLFPALFCQARAFRFQLLFGQSLEECPHAADNVYTEVALALDDSRQTKLRELLARAQETRFCADESVTVLHARG